MQTLLEQAQYHNNRIQTYYEQSQLLQNQFNILVAEVNIIITYAKTAPTVEQAELHANAAFALQDRVKLLNGQLVSLLDQMSEHKKEVYRLIALIETEI